MLHPLGDLGALTWLHTGVPGLEAGPGDLGGPSMSAATCMGPLLPQSPPGRAAEHSPGFHCVWAPVGTPLTPLPSWVRRTSSAVPQA